jgi:hypothetical protein
VTAESILLANRRRSQSAATEYAAPNGAFSLFELVFYNYAAPPALAALNRLNREPREQFQNQISLSRIWRISRLNFFVRESERDSIPQPRVSAVILR